jgi:hypothetical protein
MATSSSPLPGSKRPHIESPTENSVNGIQNVPKRSRNLSALHKAFGGDVSLITEEQEPDEFDDISDLSYRSNYPLEVLNELGCQPINHSLALTVPEALVGENLAENCGEKNSVGDLSEKDSVGNLFETNSDTNMDPHVPTGSGGQPPVMPPPPWNTKSSTGVNLTHEEQGVLNLVNANMDGILTVAFQNQSHLLTESLKASLQTIMETIMAPFLQDLQETKLMVTDLQETTKKLEERLEKKDRELELMRYKLDTQDQITRKLNFKVSGVPETRNEDVFQVVKEINVILDKNVPPEYVNKCYRVGKPQTGKIRPIVVKFNTIESRGALFKMRKDLKKHKNKKLQSVYLNEDLAPLRSKFLYVCRGLKKANLIHKYYVYDTHVCYKKTDSSNEVRVFGLSDFKDFANTEVYQHYTKPLVWQTNEAEMPEDTTQL